jgi:hypothetical protein
MSGSGDLQAVEMTPAPQEAIVAHSTPIAFLMDLLIDLG